MHIPPISAKFINFHPYFCYLSFLGFPYFDHDAFTHHALHVLDSRGWGGEEMQEKQDNMAFRGFRLSDGVVSEDIVLTRSIST